MEISTNLVTNALTTKIQKLINTVLPTYHLVFTDGKIVDSV